MQEDKSHIDYFQLIPKYLSGNASNPEVKLLEEWVLSSPENKSNFNAFKQAWILSGLEKTDQSVDVEQEWRVTADQLFAEGQVVALPVKAKGRSVFFFRIAAAAAVLLLISFGLFQVLNKEAYIEIVAQNEVEEGQLPDGTQISLNQYASIKYALGEKEEYRRLELKGDAFFEVERDTVRPFVITTPEVEIEVLGTAFYVDARTDQAFTQVIVKSGSVSMTTARDQIILTANETGIYDKNTGDLIQQPNEDVNYMAWKTDSLVFDSTPLEAVVFALNRKFHAKVSIGNPVLNTCEITATYQDKSLEAIIKIIEKTLNIETEIKGEEIIFIGQSCE